MQHLFIEKTFDRCLGCGSETLEPLELQLGSEPPQGAFKPMAHKLRWLRSAHGVTLRGSLFQMCRSCGLVFRQDSPDALTDFLARYAKD